MKEKTYKPVSYPVMDEQIKKIHALLRQTDIKDVESIIMCQTNKRSSDIKDLTCDEANDMIVILSSIIDKKPVTTAQIKKIHVLLHQKGLMEEKETIIRSISNGRTGSTKDLTLFEARQIIDFLLNETKEINNSKQRIYNAIWNIAWKMGIIYGETDDDYQMNRAKLNMFCRQRGTVKKNLSEMNSIELKSTHRQFEAMFKKYSNSKKTTNK